MHKCELCGATVAELYDHEFPDGVVLLVCLQCSDEHESMEY